MPVTAANSAAFRALGRRCKRRNAVQSNMASDRVNRMFRYSACEPRSVPPPSSSSAANTAWQAMPSPSTRKR